MREPAEEIERQGRRRLRDLLPQARVLARRQAEEGKARLNALAMATLPHVREDNLRALVVYPAPLGGYHADVLFKQVPPGVPNSMGSPVVKPYPTKEEAEAGALRLLANLLTMAAQFKAEDDAPVFLFHNASIKLPAEVYRVGLERFPDMRDGFGGPDAAAAMVAEAEAELFPDGYSFEALEALPIDGKRRLMARLVTATLSGLFAYPQRRNASPSGLSEAQQSRARH